MRDSPAKQTETATVLSSQEALEHQHKEALKEAARPLRDAGFAVTYAVGLGDPAKKITDYATDVQHRHDRNGDPWSHGHKPLAFGQRRTGSIADGNSASVAAATILAWPEDI